MRTGALATLAGGFFLSALLRTGEVVAALPLALDAGGSPTGATPETSAEETVAEGRRLRGLAADLARQRAELEAREAALLEREQLLAAIEERVRARMAELEAMEAKLRETVALADDAARRDIRRLTEMYQQMKPKRAGQIFNTMEPRFAAGFLGEMEPSAAALILANMDPERAYAVTVLLAGRNVEREAPASATPSAAPEAPAPGSGAEGDGSDSRAGPAEDSRRAAGTPAGAEPGVGSAFFNRIPLVRGEGPATAAEVRDD